eukprot:COSAG01_NODE_23930_length_796_cov_2.608321_2_plen_48_part_01
MAGIYLRNVCSWVGAALEEVVGALLKDGTLLPVELGGLEGGEAGAQGQ